MGHELHKAKDHAVLVARAGVEQIFRGINGQVCHRPKHVKTGDCRGFTQRLPNATIAAMLTVRIQTEDFDVSTELAALHAGRPQVGAACFFVGLVRERNEGDAVACMELEHYPGMTEKSIAAIMTRAQQRFGIDRATVIHRVGPLQPTEQIVLVAVTSAHRGESFAACEFIMDYLKSEAPFWKKEHTPQGQRWVDARISDETALAKWQQL